MGGWVGNFRATEPRIERWVVRSQTNCSNLHSFGNADELRKYRLSKHGDVFFKGFNPDNVHIIGCDQGFPEMYKLDFRMVYLHPDNKADFILN